MWPASQPRLVGTACALRPLTDRDVSNLVAACRDPEIARFTRVPVPYTEADARSFVSLAGHAWQSREGSWFAIADAADELIGACSVMDVNQSGSAAEIGYWVAPAARGRGAARTALGLITTWAHRELGLDRLHLQIEDANRASAVVAEAAGYRPLDEVSEWELKGAPRRLRHYQHLLVGGV